MWHRWSQSALWVLGLVLAPGSTARSPVRSDRAPRKLALIVAIGNYPPQTLYPRLDSDRDIPLVFGALLTQGFDSSGVRVVADSAATREGILGGIQWLTNEAGPGDIVVFHYSGHGHRITDDDDHDELDGYDEMLVPYGAPGDLNPASYHGERHIRDDELAPLLAALRRKVGPSGNVLVLLDACFSGSATRGLDELPVRGVLAPIEVRAPAGASYGGAGTDTLGSGLDNQLTVRGAPDSGLGPMVVISATRQDMVDHEAYDDHNQPVGSLSLALSRVLPHVDSTTTYRALFDRIEAAMAAMDLHGQRPQIEGAVDTRVFSGRAVAQAPFFKVRRLEADGGISLIGGTLVGLLPGTEVAFFPSGTTRPENATALATGTVRRADEVKAEVTLAGARPGADLGMSWVFVTRYAYGDLRIRVRLDPKLAPRAQQLVRTALTPLPIVRLVSERPDVLVSTGRGESLAITAATDNAPLGDPIDPASSDAGARVAAALRSYARTRYIRRIELTDPAIHVTLELVPTDRHVVNGVCQGSDTLSAHRRRGAGHDWELHPGDVYLLRISNGGDEPAYLTVLDLPPGSAVTQLFPPPQQLGSDNYLPEHRSYLTRDVCYVIDPTYGVEMLKLFATRERVDFTPVLSEHPTRAPVNPLEQLLADAYSGTRAPPPAAPRTGSTYSIAINVTRAPAQGRSGQTHD